MWSSKYSPKHIDDLILDDYLKVKFRKMINGNEIPNLMLSGVSCSGKTTILNCLARDFYKKDYSKYVYQLNSSVEKSVKVLQEVLESFCKQTVVTEPQKKKLFIVDDIDTIPDKIQSVIALMMEKFPNIYFTFTCNTTSSINELIQSRCLILYIQRLEQQHVVGFMRKICDNEKCKYDISALTQIYDMSQGDVRISINILQVICDNFKKVTNESVNKICNIPNPTIIQNMLNECENYNVKNALVIGINLYNEGYDCSDILGVMFDVLKSNSCQMNNQNKMKMLEIVGKIRYNVCKKNDSLLQLERCIIKLCEK